MSNQALSTNAFGSVLSRTFLFILVLLLSSSSTLAQYIDHGAIRDQMIQNMILEQRVRIFTESEQGARKQRSTQLSPVEKAGAAKIKAGKANLTFVSALSVTQNLAKSVQWESDEPQDLPGQVRFIQNYVKMFNQLAVKNGYTPNNFADGFTFAYALSYAAYYNKDLDAETLKQKRADHRQNLLTSAYFQGLSDAERQSTYEANVNMAMQAVEWRVKYRVAANEAERQKCDEKAKSFADYLLQYSK